MRLCDAYTWTPEAGDVALFKSKTDEFVGVQKYVPNKVQEDGFSVPLDFVYFGDDMPPQPEDSPNSFYNPTTREFMTYQDIVRNHRWHQEFFVPCTVNVPRAAVMAYILQQSDSIDAALWDLEAVYE